MKWSDIKFGRDDTSVVLTTALTKDALDGNAGLYQGRTSPDCPGRNGECPAGPARTHTRIEPLIDDRYENGAPPKGAPFIGAASQLEGSLAHRAEAFDDPF